MESIGETGKKRLHFGVMMTSIDYSCQCLILSGIDRYAKNNDIQLTVYIGTYQTISHDYAMQYETCFEAMRNNSSLDGIILFTGYITANIGLVKFKEYFARLPKHIPVVSISSLIPDIPSVLADNAKGMYSAVDHLIKAHGKNKIAFIKGPEDHPEAQERLNGYTKALKDNNIAFDERYILPGDFMRQCGYDAVAELIDCRRLSFDAIVASTDRTAFGVLNELKSRNIFVPKDVAVIGFDDDSGSATCIPSISTTRQDFFEIGMLSIESLYQKVRCKPVEMAKYVTPGFIRRQSCGCLENDFSSSIPEHGDIPVESNSLFSFVLHGFKTLFLGILTENQIYEWTTSLVDKVLEKPFCTSSFLYLFDEFLVSYDYYSKDFLIWRKVLGVLTMGIERYGDEVDNTQSVLSALIYATTLVHDVCNKDEKNSQLALSDFRVTLERVVSALVLIFDIDTLAEELYESLRILSINTALVGLYHSPIKVNECDANRNIDILIGFDGDTKFNVKSTDNSDRGTLLYSDHSALDEFDFEHERRTLFFFPLFFKDEELGILLLQYNTQTYIDAYETLRINISAAVKGAELLSKVQALSITDELTGLYNRRGFFQVAIPKLRHLQRSQEKIPLVLFIDMDGLKQINDTYGHKEGDIAISAFAHILKEVLRDEDIIGRIGGDEFVVLSSMKSREGVEKLTARIRARLDEYNCKELHPYKIASSFGSVVLTEATEEALESALLSADSILYEEKTEKRKKGLTRN